MRLRLDYLRRLLGTGFSFSVFGIGGVLLTVLVFPWLLLIRDPDRRRRTAQRLIAWCFRRFVGLMRGVGIFDYEIVDAHKLDRPGSVIVANHPSLIDVVLLIAEMGEVDCIVKQRLRYNPAMAAPVRAAGYISNAQGPELVDDCCERLARGHRLLIFPEGTRTRPGEPLRFQRGAANIAVQAGADIVPVVIRFSAKTLGKGQPWYHIPDRKFRIRIEVGDSLPVTAYRGEQLAQSVAARRLTEDLRAYYSRLLMAETDDAPLVAYSPEH